MLAASPAKTGYLPHIDGLRALAVLIILIFHLDVPGFSGGFIGVDVFFVISGFLITHLIAKDMRTGTFSFARFYERRIKRIFPALFVMLALTSIAAIFFLGPREYTDFFQGLRYASGQISNIHFSKEVDYFDVGNHNNPLLHTWSLGVEEQFYLVWPILLLLTHRVWGMRRASWVLGALLVTSLIISEYLVRTNAMHAFYLLHARGWELALGGLLGLRAIPPLRHRSLAEASGLLGILLILIATFTYTEVSFPGFKAVLPCLGAALFIYAAQSATGPGWVHRALSVKPMLFVGLVSYSLYLWHWPLIGMYKSYFNTSLTPAVQISIAVFSFLLAYLSYRFIEQPLRHSRLPASKTILIGILTIASFIMVSNLVKRADTAPWRITYAMESDILKANEYYDTCAKTGGAWNTQDCIIGPNPERYEVILSGDSHAGHYIPTVLEWAKANGLTVRIFLRGACNSFVIPSQTIMRHGKADTYCMELSRTFHQIVESSPHIRYIFLSLRTANGTDADLKAALERIQRYQRQTVYLGSVPEFKEHPHDCQMRNNLLVSHIFPRPQTDCLKPDAAHYEPLLEKSRSTLNPLLTRLGIAYFNPLPHMLPPQDTQGRFMFMDTNHLNRYGALHLAPHLAAFMNGLVPSAGLRPTP